MRKKLLIFLAVILTPVLAYAAFQWNGAAITVWDGASITAWNGAAVGGCSDNVITLSANGSTRTIGDGTSGYHTGSTITVATAGTLKEIRVYYYVASSQTGTITMRWKLNSIDLRSGYEEITSSTLTATNGAWYTFDVSDTAISIGDTINWGLQTSNYGNIKSKYTDNVDAAESGIYSDSASSWNLTSTVSYDEYCRYVNCY